MKIPKKLQKFVTIALACSTIVTLTSAEGDSRPTSLVQYGGMHETIGQEKHQARVGLAELLKRPHFYAVGALAGLKGEITILDSKAVVTTVNANGKPSRQANGQATLLVGQSVSAWKEVKIDEDIPQERIDETIGKLAAQNGINTSRPFFFMIEGECTEVHLHVINGACPMRARMKKEAMAQSRKPFEYETEAVKATVVGVYARDSVGKLTHPGTSQHAHLIYPDPATKQQMTGHLEEYGVKKGATLKLPMINEPKRSPRSGGSDG
jgi:acetolactate decarboxylase